MKKNIAYRINLIINELGYTKNSFSKKIGLTNNVTIGRIINENRKPSYDIIEKIIQTFGSINTDWLITGKGEMLKNQNSQIEIEKNIVNEQSVEYKTNKEDFFLKMLDMKDKEIEKLSQEIGKLKYINEQLKK